MVGQDKEVLLNIYILTLEPNSYFLGAMAKQKPSLTESVQ
jgi:hypothetical protein